MIVCKLVRKKYRHLNKQSQPTNKSWLILLTMNFSTCKSIVNVYIHAWFTEKRSSINSFVTAMQTSSRTQKLILVLRDFQTQTCAIITRIYCLRTNSLDLPWWSNTCISLLLLCICAMFYIVADYKSTVMSRLMIFSNLVANLIFVYHEPR